MAEVTKCFTWSMPDMYARGLCSMKLDAESDNTARTCSICVKAVKPRTGSGSVSTGSSGGGSSGSGPSMSISGGDS